ncbi:phosphoenolpyruvate-protein phosphotransferase [Cellulomonas bogoriensis 69B4 = DSM 16987]|uniref:Phosphoenolpyruvate-protein phosphotransferase n=2 Tax=Cellulomonas bogoriensis TaxID=301388 RepID=A0A0A0BPH2_9CELL|nr:putative PEP-binding protein [Cellulomonas bogoriensis]KGM09816.1 phosphoenolpyruvate-protein phosphotransferase [Cellulomonas bogoriensis 69B4 = DSM 16987]
MRVLHGQGVGRGAVVGPAVTVHAAPSVPWDLLAPGDPDAEVVRALTALDAVATTLEERAGRTAGAIAEVLRATASIARDPELRDQVRGRVMGGQPAALAVDRATAEVVEAFTAAGGYLAERVTDVRSVRDRAVALLQDLPEPGVPALDRPSVVLAHDLAPADTAALDLTKVLGVVLEHGGPTGHTAIIAGQLGIPCVVQVVGALAVPDGVDVAVDAAAGAVVVAPDREARRRVEARRDALADLERDTRPGRTADGSPVPLLANVGGVEDLDAVDCAGLEGVGLLRTEVLFLGRSAAPGLQEQVDAYRRVIETAGDRRVVIRTLDAGADKPLAFVTRRGEENPALGVRGFRTVRDDPELLRDQVLAIAQAARETGREVQVMAPMISTVQEAAQFAALARDCGITSVGVMVEVPAAALRTRDLLAEVDFVSIGTNDLAQYAMAADRLHGGLIDLLDTWQPAVLDLVATAARAGADAGRPVGVCGESAADPLMALVLVGLGAGSLSMSPAAAPAVRFAIARHTTDRCRAIAQAARGAVSPDGARAAALDLLDAHVREVLSLP